MQLQNVSLGKHLLVPDTFFCGPLSEMDSNTTKDVYLYRNSIVNTRFATDSKKLGNPKYHTHR